MQPTAGFMTHVTCRLTAKNWDQLRNPTLGNRVWAAFLHADSRERRLIRPTPSQGHRSSVNVTGGKVDAVDYCAIINTLACLLTHKWSVLPRARLL